MFPLLYDFDYVCCKHPPVKQFQINFKQRYFVHRILLSTQAMGQSTLEVLLF
jgi:hypothetical protein